MIWIFRMIFAHIHSNFVFDTTSRHTHHCDCVFIQLTWKSGKNGILLPKLFWPYVRKNCSKGYVSLDRLICFFAYFVLFGSWKKKVVDFYLPNSRFHWLFQEPAQDLTLFNFLKENCYIGWMTYKSTTYTESNKYFYISVSKNVRRQENYCYEWLHFFNSVWQKFFFLVDELSELLSCWQDGLAPAIKFWNDNWFFLKNK